MNLQPVYVDFNVYYQCILYDTFVSKSILSKRQLTVRNFVESLGVSFAPPTLSSTNPAKTFEVEEVDWCLRVKFLINTTDIRGEESLKKITCLPSC